MKSFSWIISLALFSLTAPLLSAAPLDWDPGASGGANLGGSGNWNTLSALWFNGSADIAWVNLNNDDAIFSGAAGTVTLTQNIAAGDLYFTNVLGSMIITNATGAETLTLGNGTVDTGGGDDIIGAVLAGSQPLNKNGAGTLELRANNSGFTGGINVNVGALEVENINALGSAVATVTNGATMEFTSGGTIANAFVLSGGGLNNTGALLNLSGSPTFSGAVTLETTNLVFGGATGTTFDMEGGVAAAGSVNANVLFTGGASFRVSATATTKVINLHAGSITLAGGSLNMESTSLTYSNLVVNGGQFSFATSDKGFGTAPSTFEANNITLSNSANMLASHTFTFNANRGIYLGPGGGLLGENTGAGQGTIPGVISGPGNLTFEVDGAGSSWKLTGNNTYTGLTTVQNGAALFIGNNGSSGTFGTGNIVDNGAITIFRTGTISYAGAISGTGSLTLEGAGTIILSGPSTYTGQTIDIAQYFMVDNTNGSGTGTGTLTVGSSTSSGGFLGGTGIILGPVTIDAGNTLQPGNPVSNTIGTLAISNSLTFQPGSFSVLNIDATVPTNSSVVGLTSVTYGGTLTVNLLNGTLAAGQTYQLFGAGSYGGSFEGGIQLPGLAAGLLWNTNNLYVNGTISVTGENGTFNPPVVSGNSLILSGTSGLPNGTFNVLSTTNLATPVASWKTVSTGNSFDGSGNFNVTNTIDPSAPQEFFMIQQP